MRILAMADEPDRKLWSERCREIVTDVDLILSCGDLPADYLSFLTCFTHAPILYVPGNHDSRYESRPPEGCVCADGRIIGINGLRVLGLGGSMRYRPDAPCMYSEEEMQARIRKLRRSLCLTGGFDILMTHAPVSGTGDQTDLAHRGFGCFGTLLDQYRPAAMFHGHIHQSYSGSGFVRERQYNGIPVINACGYCLFDLPDSYTAQKKPHRLGMRLMEIPD